MNKEEILQKYEKMARWYDSREWIYEVLGMRQLAVTVLGALVVTGLVLQPEARAGSFLAAKGQKALLEYSIEIDGKAQGEKKSEAASEQWSTRRSLVVTAVLIAQPPSVEDPGDPGGPHRVGGRPKESGYKPSNLMMDYMAELQKCGEDLQCKMRVAEKMRKDPNLQGDLKKAKDTAEELGKGKPRYQFWLVDSKTPATGTVKIEDNFDGRYKTAVDERRTCHETAEIPFEKFLNGVRWPATIKIDAQEGTYVADIEGLDNTFSAKVDCVGYIGRDRGEEHSTSGRKLLPEKYQQAEPGDVEVFRGGADAAAGGRRLARAEKVFIGTYGTLVGGATKTAKVTVRWSLTLKD